MPIPNSMSPALRAWRPAELAVMSGDFERTPDFCLMHDCICAITDRVFHTLGCLTYNQPVDLSAASADVMELVQRYETIVADFGLEFRRTDEARELDIFLFASEELAREFATMDGRGLALVS
jgi:hypothetical protein